MNILHHKSWHVRNKDNIERVRRDEEKAANEEKERQRRIALSESEARTDLLRTKSRKQLAKDNDSSELGLQKTVGHVNLFQEIEGDNAAKGNEEYEKEKKEEKEKQEKALGILTYLGQSAIEAQTEKPWYQKAKTTNELPSTSQSGRDRARDESDIKVKNAQDPMHLMMKYVDVTKKKESANSKTKPRAIESSSSRRPVTATSMRDVHKPECPLPPVKRKRESSASSILSESSDDESSRKSHKKAKKNKHKRKKHKISSKEKKKEKKEKKKKHKKEKRRRKERSPPLPTSKSSKSLQELRAERLKREQNERKKAERLLAEMRGEKLPEDIEKEKQSTDSKRKYNSQYNPDFVRKPKKKNYEAMM